MTGDERLESARRLAVEEELRAVLRHDLRNRLASIRNAAFYLRLRVEKHTELLTTDPRCAAFFQLIQEELLRAEELIAERLAPGDPRVAPAEREGGDGR